MSTFAVTAERLQILPHSNADALELAVIGGYRAVVLKGRYKSGDFALYIPEAAILPDALIDELGLTGRLSGKEQNRVSAIRLRGELSQGIVCHPSAIAGRDLAAAAQSRFDFGPELGVTKWAPEIPAELLGEVERAPALIDWIDIENIKRHMTAFTPGEPVTAGEKLHGISTLCTMDFSTDELLVSTKGLGPRQFAMRETAGNKYWLAIRANDVEAKIRAIGAKLGAKRLALFGETYGVGIQDLHYGIEDASSPGFAVFDAKLDLTGDGAAPTWIDQVTLRSLCAEVGLACVPLLYEGPYDYQLLSELAGGKTVAGGGNIREGLVVRTVPERFSPEIGGRAIAKFISADYLLRKGGTEYE